MGTDKATLMWHGKPLLHHVVERLRTAFEQVIVVGGRAEWAPSGWLADEQEGAGVAAAILTALRHLQQPCFVCACDMPFVNANLALWLLQSAQGSAAHVPCWLGQSQPLHAGWFPSSIAFLQESLSLGERTVWRILQRMEEAGALLWANEEQVRRFDPEGRCFVNLNTPEEWQWWQS